MPQITLIFVILFGITLSAHGATVYRYTDENGNTVFTDEPVEGAKKLDVKPIATVPAIPVPQPTPAPPKEEPFKYTSIKITNPSNEQFFINDPGQIQVVVSIAPNLAQGHQVQLYFNGSPQGDPKAGNVFRFKQLDRGEYRTHALILDENGKEVGKSDTITFFVKRHSISRPNSG